MTSLNIEIGRMHLSLDGVSRELAEEAAGSLESELRAQLSESRWSELRIHSIEINHVRIMASAQVSDAVTLRRIIASRIVAQITGSLNGGEDPS